MKLLRKPFKPKSLPLTPTLRVDASEIPLAWQPFVLPAG
jgi:hypothetical protein